MTALTKLRSAMTKLVKQAEVRAQQARPAVTPPRADGFDVKRAAKVSLRADAPAPVIPDAATVRATSAPVTAARLAATRAAVADPDGLQRFLEGADRVYQEELGRPLLGDNTDVSGVGSFGALHVNEGFSLDQVRAAVRQSDEWREKHPGEDAGPAPSGGRSKNLVSAQALTEAAQSVKDLYREELQRNPDVSGLSHYSAALLNKRLDADGLRDVLRASDEYRQLHAQGPVEPGPTPTPGPGPVDPNPQPAGPTRTGRVRLEGNSFADDQGQFNALGATYMSALWQFQNDKPRLEQTLAEMKKNGVDYIRVLGTVGDYDRADYWDGREIDWRWPDYKDAINGLTDLAYDKYGLRVEWTLIGDGQKNDPHRVRPLHADRPLPRHVAGPRAQDHALRGGQRGLAERLRRRRRRGPSCAALTKYLNDRTDVLVAASAPDGFECRRRRDAVRRAASPTSRPTTSTATSRRPRGTGARCGSRGNGSTPRAKRHPPGGNQQRAHRPGRVAWPARTTRCGSWPRAVVSYVSGLPGYVYHTHAGVRGDEDFSSTCPA